jgi:hypothetical protein
MSYTTSAIASPQRLYTGQPGTGATTLCVAPAVSVNVTGLSATTIVKEVMLCNTTALPATVTMGINGVAAADQIIGTLTIAANDTKIISFMNTMLSAGDTLQALQGTGSAITVTVSGVVIQ